MSGSEKGYGRRSHLILRDPSLKLIDHAVEFGIASAKAPCDPVPTALGNRLTVRDHVELASLTTDANGVYV